MGVGCEEPHVRKMANSLRAEIDEMRRMNPQSSGLLYRVEERVGGKEKNGRVAESKDWYDTLFLTYRIILLSSAGSELGVSRQKIAR